LYWFNIFLLGVVLLIGWRMAMRHGLVAEAMRGGSVAIERRIIVAQALYAVGALLCVFNTSWSLAFIILLQLNYALAPAYTRRWIP
jgi:uncharacterized membrane protein